MSSNPPPAEQTTHYNIYAVSSPQSTGPPHQGIALIPSHFPSQNRGRFYHVKGTVGMGMDYECLPGYHFGPTTATTTSATPSSQPDQTSSSSSDQSSSPSPSFEFKFEFKIPKSDLSVFEQIAQNTPPPHDPRALTERNPVPPLRKCGDWVREVLGEVSDRLVGDGSMDG